MIRALFDLAHVSAPPMRDPGDLAPLRLVVVPNPVSGEPSDVLFVRGTDAFLLAYAELQSLAAAAPSVADAMAQASAHYGPADVPPPAEPLN